jgi:thiol-disulfide isomerase/thioredoxin
MKCFLFVFLLCLTKSLCWAQNTNFTIKGRLKENSEAKKVYVKGNRLKIEVPVSPDKEFTYVGFLSEPELCYIETDKSSPLHIWVTTGEITISLEEYDETRPVTDPLGKSRLKINAISGPAEVEKYQWFAEEEIRIGKRFPWMPSFAQYRDSMAKYYDPLLEEYILLHPHSKFSFYVSRLAFGRANINKFLSLLDKRIGGEEGLRMEWVFKRDSATKTGLLVEDFEIKMINGQMFSSKNLSSTYTLLDFWAHDCYPCRAQHPGLIKVYNEFHPKGFEVIAVALDESKTMWRKAVAQDKVPWIHVSDLKGWDNFLARRYYVDAIPFNILIDKNKRIIAAGLSTEALRQKLAELLIN